MQYCDHQEQAFCVMPKFSFTKLISLQSPLTHVSMISLSSFGALLLPSDICSDLSMFLHTCIVYPASCHPSIFHSLVSKTAQNNLCWILVETIIIAGFL